MLRNTCRRPTPPLIYGNCYITYITCAARHLLLLESSQRSLHEYIFRWRLSTDGWTLQIARICWWWSVRLIGKFCLFFTWPVLIVTIVFVPSIPRPSCPPTKPKTIKLLRKQQPTATSTTRSRTPPPRTKFYCDSNSLLQQQQQQPNHHLKNNSLPRRQQPTATVTTRIPTALPPQQQKPIATSTNYRDNNNNITTPTTKTAA